MSNAQKINFIHSLSSLHSEQIKQDNSIVGKDLPCHVTAVNGAIVTVQFDILPGIVDLPEVTMPVFGSEYVRKPIQLGDKGVTVSASVSLRGVSGLGVGMADMSRPLTLSALYFMPLGNIDWEKTDPDMLTLYGPKGVHARTTSGKASVDIQDDAITLTVGGHTLELSAAGLMHNGVNVGSSHIHAVENVQSGNSTIDTQVPE